MIVSRKEKPLAAPGPGVIVIAPGIKPVGMNWKGNPTLRVHTVNAPVIRDRTANQPRIIKNVHVMPPFVLRFFHSQPELALRVFVRRPLLEHLLPRERAGTEM